MAAKHLQSVNEGRRAHFEVTKKVENERVQDSVRTYPSSSVIFHKVEAP